MRLQAAAAALALFSIALSGCVAPATETPPPPAELPSPPQELSLVGVHACDTLSADQLATLDIDDETYNPPRSGRGPNCQWSHFPGEPDEGYLIELLLNRDVVEFLALPGRTTAIEIDGFPAVQTDYKSLGTSRAGSCTTLVGVATGQTLQVSYDYDGDQPVTLEQSCAKARTAAEMAVETLIAQSGAR